MTQASREPNTRPMQDAWWLETLDKLRAELDSLVEDFITRLRTTGSGYEGISEDDVRATARETLTLLIATLRGERVSSELTSLAQRLGVRRARQGVDRDRLLEAVRLDYRVLWSGLTRVVPSADAGLLLSHSELVLSAVEAHIGEVQVAFLNERDAFARESRVNETRAFARLLAADEPAVVAREVAQELGLTVDAEFEAILIPDTSAAEARARVSELQLSRQRFLIWDFDDGVLFVRTRQAGMGRHPLSGIRGVLIDHIQGLAAVADAARLAHRLLAHAPSGQLSEEHDLWPPVAATVLAPLLPGLSPQAVEGLNAISSGDRERLVATFLSYCETGSVKRTAETGFVHRNTVVNRLRTFHDLTGINPTVPREAARGLIALAGATFEPSTSPQA